MPGLLVFLLAFPFGLAASRFDERRHTVLDEPDAIGTASLTAGLPPELQRSVVIRDYWRNHGGDYDDCFDDDWQNHDPINCPHQPGRL